MKITKDYSLLPHNTFGMDVKASLFIEYDSVEELKQILRDYPLEGDRWLHIGAGSNLLFTGDYPGIVLHSCIRGFEVVAEDAEAVIVRVGAGEVWDDFVAYAVSNEWYGAENLSLIPGEVGASAVQNIGAYGVEAKDLIVEVETIEVATGKECMERRVWLCLSGKRLQAFIETPAHRDQGVLSFAENSVVSSRLRQCACRIGEKRMCAHVIERSRRHNKNSRGQIARSESAGQCR